MGGPRRVLGVVIQTCASSVHTIHVTSIIVQVMLYHLHIRDSQQPQCKQERPESANVRQRKIREKMAYLAMWKCVKFTYLLYGQWRHQKATAEGAWLLQLDKQKNDIKMLKVFNFRASWSANGWFPKLYLFFLLHRCISDENFTKISQWFFVKLLTDWQTDRQIDR